MADDLASLQLQLTALKTAYRSGTRKVGYDGKNVEYGTMAEMREAIASLEAAVGVTRPTSVVIRSEKGW